MKKLFLFGVPLGLLVGLLGLLSLNLVTASNHDKVVLCHKEAGKKPKTMEVSQNAVADHLAHGDTEGPCLPDLTVEILDVTENCASADDCTQLVDLVVRNQGQGDAGPSDLHVIAPVAPSGSTIVQVNGLGAGEEQSFVDLSLGPHEPSCYLPDCRVIAQVDIGDDVTESNETNNADSVLDSSPS
jgi:hypothetical protein